MAAAHFTLNTGARVPSVGLGTYKAAPGVIADVLGAAVKAGYRHIDCAPLYNNEKEIGVALKKLFDDGVVKRQDLFITSKIWHGKGKGSNWPCDYLIIYRLRQNRTLGCGLPVCRSALPLASAGRSPSPLVQPAAHQVASDRFEENSTSSNFGCP